MAQGAVVSRPSQGVMALTGEELHEILECEKIVRFRDAILAGVHPKITIPAHLNGKSTTRRASSSGSVAAPSSVTQAVGHHDTSILGLNSDIATNNTSAKVPASSRVFASRPHAPPSKAEIDPILLEKSEDLIKAEIQLQRQRLERALREQVEQRRLSLKASSQTSESLPDFDISDVLSKALTIVHPTTAEEDEAAAADEASESDSFDENTFYSSQHDTPERSTLSQERNGAMDRVVASGVTASLSGMFDKPADESQDLIMADAPVANSGPIEEPYSPKSHLHAPQAGSNDRNSRQGPGSALGGIRPDPDNSGSGSAHKRTQERQIANMTDASGDTVMDTGSKRVPAVTQRRVYESESSISADMQEPAIVRTRDVVPTLAPQPARVSPLATARIPPYMAAVPATQTANAAHDAVEGQLAEGSSPESSGKGSKPLEKRKKKKKARKSAGKNGSAVETPDSPYIKPEPRSPSPLGGISLSRPIPRPQHISQQAQVLDYDEPRREASRAVARQVSGATRSRQRVPRPMYGGHEDDRMYEYDPGVYDYSRPVEIERQSRSMVSQDVYSAHSPPAYQSLRSLRTAPHAVIESAPESPRYYRDVPPRSSVRPDSGRERSRSPIIRERRSPIMMAPPPRLQPMRIMVDEYGREFHERVPLPIHLRQSVAPVSRNEDDFIYERNPVRRAPAFAAHLYEEDEAMYRGSAPSVPPPRRVITLPEQDHRSYRQREYSVRPVTRTGPAEDYLPVAAPYERRQIHVIDDLPREFAARAGSIRPESLRYPAPRESMARLHSVRPEGPPLPSYRASVRPESQREMPMVPLREYSVRPGEPERVRRQQYGHREGSYAPVRQVRRVYDEPEYMEVARNPTQEVYMEDGRPEVLYR
jgi:hypothetical protein